MVEGTLQSPSGVEVLPEFWFISTLDSSVDISLSYNEIIILVYFVFKKIKKKVRSKVIVVKNNSKNNIL